MKKIFGVFVVLLLTATLFAALPLNVGAGSSHANTQVPFKSDFDGGNVATGSPYWERIVASGQANQLGEYTAVVNAFMPDGVIIGWVPIPGVPFPGFPIILLPTSVTFTAANGDELYATMYLTGMYHLGDMNFPAFTMDAKITGGTGRFAGATGYFTGTGGQITMPGEDTDLVTGTFAGKISTVGSSK